MDARRFYAGKGSFIKKEDLIKDGAARNVTLKVTRVVEVSTPEGEAKLALEFENTPKKFQLNKTNFSVMEAAFGFDTDSWVGKSVTLAHDPNVKFRGKVVGGVALTANKK